MTPTHYEHQKHSGELPIVGVNTFLNPEEKGHEKTTLELARSNSDEKNDQIKRLRDFQARHSSSRHSRAGGNPISSSARHPGESRDPASLSSSDAALARLKQTAINNGNIFEALMDAVRVCSLGQITHALFEVGGQYRRNM